MRRAPRHKQQLKKLAEPLSLLIKSKSGPLSSWGNWRGSTDCEAAGRYAEPLAEEDSVDAGILSALPDRRAHSDPRRRHQRPLRLLQRSGREHVRHVQHVLRRRPAAFQRLRARRHALYLVLHHRAAPDGRRAPPRAALQGGRSGPEEDQRLHPLWLGASLDHPRRHDRPHARRLGFQRPQHGAESRPSMALHHRPLADRRLGLHHVARRADHRARRRQRHVADHLLRHRRVSLPQRHHQHLLAVQQRRDGRRPHPLDRRHLPRRHRWCRVHRAGRAAGADPVRQAPGRPESLRRPELAPADPRQ